MLKNWFILLSHEKASLGQVWSPFAEAHQFWENTGRPAASSGSNHPIVRGKTENFLRMHFPKWLVFWLVRPYQNIYTPCFFQTPLFHCISYLLDNNKATLNAKNIMKNRNKKTARCFQFSLELNYTDSHHRFFNVLLMLQERVLCVLKGKSRYQPHSAISRNVHFLVHN